jgi:hypothetical protein
MGDDDVAVLIEQVAFASVAEAPEALEPVVDVLVQILT